MKQSRRRVVGTLVAALLAHLLLWVAVPLMVKAAAALLLTALLPGWLLVTLLLRGSDADSDWGTHAVDAIGGGLALTVVIMLLLSYLPGGITGWLVLTVFDGLWIGLLLLVGRSTASLHAASPRPTQSLFHPWLIALTLVLLIGGYFRFAQLGYAEFLTDEARVVSVRQL